MVKVVSVHGISNEIAGYSKKWRDALSPLSSDLKWFEYYWDDIADSAGKIFPLLNMLQFIPLIGSIFNKLDEFSDAVRYRFFAYNWKGLKIAIVKDFTLELERHLRNSDERINILAHSLGTVIAYEAVQKLSPLQQTRVRLILVDSPLCNAFERWFLGVKFTPVCVDNVFHFYGEFDPISGRDLTIPKTPVINTKVPKIGHDQYEMFRTVRESIIKTFL